MNKMKKKYTGYFFILPAFTGVMIFYILPFFDVIRRSFTSVYGGGFAGIGNYTAVLTNGAFLKAVANTVRFTLLGIPLLMALSLLLALGLTGIFGKYRQAAALLKSTFLVPMALPAASVVLFFRLLFHGKGFFNAVLSWFGFSGADWMSGMRALFVLIFCYIWKNAGYTTVLWMAGFAGVPESVYEAAKVDGAGAWNTFWHITIPMIRPVIFMIAMISLLNSFQIYREVWLLAGNYPAEPIYLVQHVFHNWFLSLSMDKIAAGAVLLCIFVAILIEFLQRIWEK